MIPLTVTAMTNADQAHFLPVLWSAGDLTVRDVRADEVQIVAGLHQSLSSIGEFDPSFLAVEMAEYKELVDQSVAGESDGKPFRLQIISDEIGEPCGYFHAYAGLLAPEILLISMFLIHPSRAHSGIGARIVAGLASNTKALGFTTIHVAVFLRNTVALQFWVKQGFDRIYRFRPTEETKLSDPRANPIAPHARGIPFRVFRPFSAFSGESERGNVTFSNHLRSRFPHPAVN